MRSGLSLVMAVLLLAALAPPTAEAASRGARGTLERALDDVPSPLGLALLGFGAAGMLVVAAWAGRRAMTPRRRRPPRRSFHAGRGRGIQEGMERAHAPLDSLRQSGLGAVEVEAIPAGVRVRLQRGRSTPCEYALGYVTGLFEGAWADDVRVDHPACAGKDRHGACVYEVRRPRPSPVPAPRPRDPIVAGGPGAAASTRG